MKPCYLILEDEPIIAMDLKYAFEDAGAFATTAGTCAEALSAMERNDLVGAVLDVNLGRGETCEEAAKRLRARDIPFVLHTGDLNRVGEFLRSIGAPILAKPRAAEDVIGYIMNMARGQDAPRT